MNSEILGVRVNISPKNLNLSLYHSNLTDGKSEENSVDRAQVQKCLSTDIPSWDLQ